MNAHWWIPVAAYLLGSIPFGLLIARIFAGQDIRAVGSGNIGAANVARNAGLVPGVMTLLLDAGKGYFAVWIAQIETGNSARWMMLAAVVAVIGHVFPVWLRFKGGKGVATGLGVFLAVAPAAALVAAATYGAVVALTRISSAGSLAAATALLVAMFVTGRPAPVLVLGVASWALIVVRHRANIARLIRGKEGRF